MSHSYSPDEIDQLSEQFESKSPQEILSWAVAEFAPDIALSSSFQTQSLPLLHMAVQVMPDIRVFFLNTGYHFWDTMIFREQLAREFNMNVTDLYRDPRWDVFRDRKSVV